MQTRRRSINKIVTSRCKSTGVFMTLTLNIVTCSTRPGRIGPSIAQWFLEYAREHSAFDCQLVDLANFELPVYNEAKHPATGIYEHEHTRNWAASVNSADAFVYKQHRFPPYPAQQHGRFFSVHEVL
jgi:hypothetical protein